MWQEAFSGQHKHGCLLFKNHFAQCCILKFVLIYFQWVWHTPSSPNVGRLGADCHMERWGNNCPCSQSDGGHNLMILPLSLQYKGVSIMGALVPS